VTLGASSVPLLWASLDLRILQERNQVHIKTVVPVPFQMMGGLIIEKIINAEFKFENLQTLLYILLVIDVMRISDRITLFCTFNKCVFYFCKLKEIATY
jgi:hypothetical protein